DHDHPLQEWIETVQSAATARPDHEAIPLLMYCVALDPSRSRTTLLLEKIALSDEWRLLPEIIRALPLDELSRESVAPIIQTLHHLGRQDVVACLISVLLDRVDWEAPKSASGLEGVFSCLLGDLRLLG